MGWSGDMLQARDRADAAGMGVRIDYAIPEEGALMWSDMMVIPAVAPHPGNAHRFIDQLIGPEVIAESPRVQPRLLRQRQRGVGEISRSGDGERPRLHSASGVRENLYVTGPCSSTTTCAPTWRASP